MNWPDLLGQLVVTLIGTGVGVFLGLKVDRHQRGRQEKQDDEREIQALVSWLASRQAFREVRDPQSSAEVDAEDLDRCTKSVLRCREEISRAAKEIRTLVGVRPILASMEDDCAVYLSWARIHPGDYVIGSMALRSRILENEKAIMSIVPTLEVSAPGSRGSSAEWLSAKTLSP